MRAAAVLVATAAACGGSSGPAAVDAGGDGAPPEVDAGTPDAGGLTIADCSHFATIADHFAYLNQTRRDYEPHDRYRGIPWQGAYHNAITFPLVFTWSDPLASTAQTEASRIAAGGQPVGVFVPGQNGENRDMWIDGLDTGGWRITAREAPGDWEAPPFGHEKAALHPSNGSARMGLFYHDFGGAGPVITAMGLGGATTPACEVVWVLQMGV